jgi:CPA1 family monovalent cation:H+ antiporter
MPALAQVAAAEPTGEVGVVVVFELVLFLLVAVAVLVTVARRVSVPYPVLLVLGGLVLGLVLSLVPDAPTFPLDPELVLVVFLPPIIFAAAWQTPIRDFRANRRPILLLSVGLVLFSTVVVGFVGDATIPGLSLAAAMTLGAIVAPPDALAATTVLERLDVPRRLVTVLEGESLVNDATALTAYRVAGAATLSGAFVLAQAIGDFAYVVVVGMLVGLVIGIIAGWLWRRLFDPPVEVTLSLVIPYAAYLPAEWLGGSGVIAVVAAGLYLGARSSRILASDARLLGSGVWQIVTFLVNGLAFILVGLQLPTVLRALSDRPAAELVAQAAIICLTVIVARFVWVFPATYLPRWLVPSIRAVDPAPPPSYPLVVAWAGMRGAVSLAAALALPFAFPERDLILFLTFAVILVTLVGQGLTLGPLLMRLGLSDGGAEQREEAIARAGATAAALAELSRLREAWPDHLPLIENVEERYRHRQEHLPLGEDRHGPTNGSAGEPSEADQERREHLAILGAVITAEREKVILMRDRGVISDGVLRRIERELDLEELRLEADA